jgi:chromosomal replication initiation ATPase DnaA
MKTETMIRHLYQRGYAVSKVDPIPLTVLLRCVNATCARFRVKRSDLLSELRTDEISIARYAAWDVLASLGYSHASIGGAFLRDSTSITKALPKAQACKDGKSFLDAVEFIRQRTSTVE